MEEKNLKLVQKDIEEALKVIEDMEICLDQKESSNEFIKEKFIFLSEKVLELETILKNEGIL